MLFIQGTVPLIMLRMTGLRELPPTYCLPRVRHRHVVREQNTGASQLGLVQAVEPTGGYPHRGVYHTITF